ncbi:LLM class flavin-dependent oxidoreductase, partial [Microbacterium sp. HSID17254]
LEVAADDPLRAAAFDTPVTVAEAARLGERGAALVERLAGIAGLRVGTPDAPTWRHLVAAHAVPAAFVVGDADTIADHFAHWRDEGAADGFNVLSAFQPGQFEAFTRLAAPELRRRGLLRTPEETGQGAGAETLRDRLRVTSRVGA